MCLVKTVCLKLSITIVCLEAIIANTINIKCKTALGFARADCSNISLHVMSFSWASISLLPSGL